MLGFGVLNYMGRNAIYGKPILLGNLIFHTIAAINLLKLQ